MWRTTAALALVAAILGGGAVYAARGRAVNAAPGASCPEGHTLYLRRRGPTMPETVRACVTLPGDCQFIAGVLQEREPLVIWFCR